MAIDLIDKVGPGGHFIEEDHTMGESFMKITGIKVTPVNIPLEIPLLWTAGLCPGTSKAIVEVETDEGVVGLGEAPSAHLAPAIQDLAPRLIGRDPLDMDGIENRCVPPWQIGDVIKGGPFRPKNNTVPVPEGPGLGVDLDRDALDHWHRHFVDNGAMDHFYDPDRPGVYRRLPLCWSFVEIHLNGEGKPMTLDKQILYLSQTEVAETGLTMAEIVEAVEKAFEEMGNGRVEMPPKPGIHPGEGGDNFIHAMPAYIPALKSAGLKWVSGYPGNQAKGLPYITGLLILNDPDTGIPMAVMDCAWITAMRTAAASAVSAKYLARPESSTIGILACGVQGHTNLEAMNVLFPLKKVLAYDTVPEQSAKLAGFAAEKLGLEVEIVDDPRRAVTGCDMVVTSGPIVKNPHETIRAGWLEPGSFASLVDFDSYWSRNALAQADKWTTDNLAQYHHYKDEVGFFQDCPPVHAELGELVTGKKPGRENAEERTFAANLGLAIDDMAVAPLIYRRAVETKTGTWLPL
jgi:ornithine cyclodeaminase/alanine dehydrogenase